MPVRALIAALSVSVGEDIVFGLHKTVNNEEFKHTHVSSWGTSKELCCSSILGEDVMQLEKAGCMFGL